MLGLIGRKLGMTQIYREDGSVVPVTVVHVAPNVVLAQKTVGNCGYNAIQVAHEEQKQGRLSRPVLGQFKKAKVAPHRHIREFRTERAAEFPVGSKISAAALSVGDRLNVQGRSKGKGFQGVIKRHHFAGGCDSHGNSLSHRVPGSIGQNTYPGRVIKGKKLPGHMGDKTVTVKNLEVVGVEAEQGIVLVLGAIPGGQNARVFLYPQGPEFEDRVLKGLMKGQKGKEQEKAEKKDAEKAA